MTYLNDLLHRLRSSIAWIAAQFWATLLIVLAGVAWTRLPDKHAWQVLLSLLLPLLIVTAALWLQAGTMRSLLVAEPKHKTLWEGALILAAWAIVVWISWAILNWCDNQIPLWASYLNSRTSSHWRDSAFTYLHLVRWLTLAEWILRWIVVPGKVIPYALASSVFGWQVPMGRVLRILQSWRWWPMVIVGALAGSALTHHLFEGLPSGTVQHQIVAVIFKVGGTYLLAVLTWILVLGWGAVLLARQPQPAEDAIDQKMIQRLYNSRFWIAALAGWVLLSALVDIASAHLSGAIGQEIGFEIIVALVMIPLIVIVLAGMIRSMMSSEGKPIRFFWGALSMLAWTLPALAVAALISLFHGSVFLQIACWVIVPGVLIPCIAASTQRGFRLPWRHILQVHSNWRWWTGVLLTLIVGLALPELLHANATSTGTNVQEEIPNLRSFAADLFLFGSWVLLLCWFAVLWDSCKRNVTIVNDDSVALPLTDNSEDGAGNT